MTGTPNPPAQGRALRLLGELRRHGLEALVVTNATNIRYLTGFTGSNGTVVVTNEATTLITDSRYTERAAEEIAAAQAETGIDVVLHIAAGASTASVGDLVTSARTIGLEAHDLSWAAATKLQEQLTTERVKGTNGLVEGLRQAKSDGEIERMTTAAGIADEALQEVIDGGILGRTEREVQRSLDSRAVDLGADGASFDTIVASGPNSSRPHHEASDRTIVAGDLVIIDFGAEVEGYRSDMTRSFILGGPTDQQQRMLDAVMEAQSAGVETVRPDVVTSEIDAACRAVLADHDLAEYFTHGTGHGVGLDIHEAPSVSSTSTATLAPGHVVTVEPGVYIPDVGGVRWEDTVVVTMDGAKALTNSPKQPYIDL